MAKTEDILNMLRQISDTRRASGQMGMAAMQHQGEAFGKVGDRFNEMIDTWVAKGEAKKKRDFEGGEKQRDRDFSAEQNMLDAQQKEALMRQQRAAEQDRMYFEGLEGDKTRASNERAARIKAQGDNQGKPMLFDPAERFAAVAEMVNAYDDVTKSYKYDVLRENKAKVLGNYDAMLKNWVEAGLMSDEQRQLYYSEMDKMIDANKVPIPDGGDGKGVVVKPKIGNVDAETIDLKARQFLNLSDKIVGAYKTAASKNDETKVKDIETSTRALAEDSAKWVGNDPLAAQAYIDKIMTLLRESAPSPVKLDTTKGGFGVFNHE